MAWAARMGLAGPGRGARRNRCGKHEAATPVRPSVSRRLAYGPAARERDPSYYSDTLLAPVLILALCPLPSPGALAGETAAALDREEIAALTIEIAPIVEEIRGAKFRHPVPVAIIDDAGARAHFKERLRKYWPAARPRIEPIPFAARSLVDGMDPTGPQVPPA